METYEILLRFFNLHLPIVLSYTTWKAQKIFSGVEKWEYGEEISEQEYLKENKEFPIWFPSKKLR